MSTPSLWDFVDQLGNEDAYQRREAADEIAKLGASAKGAVPKLMEAMRDKELSVRISAAHALGAIGPGAKAAIPTLVEMAKSDEWAGCRWTAVAALGHFGPDAAAVVPVLVEMLNCFMGTPATIAWTAGQIGKAARDTLPGLETQMKRSREPGMREAAKLARETILDACVE